MIRMEGLKQRKVTLEQLLDIYLAQRVIQYSDYLSSISVMSILKFILRNETQLPSNMTSLFLTRIHQVKEASWLETCRRVMHVN
jgi:hypothetical protein